MSLSIKKFVQEQMCKPVRYSAYLTRVFEGNKSFWKPVPLDDPRDGWLIGVRWLLQGVYNRGSRYNPFLSAIDDGESPSFKETGPRRQAYLVVPWPTTNPVPVPPESVVVLGADDNFNPSAWSQEVRRMASRWTKNTERDPEGKFVK